MGEAGVIRFVRMTCFLEFGTLLSVRKAIARGTAITDYFLSFLFEIGGGQRRSRFARGLARVFAWLGAGHRYAYLIAGTVAVIWALSGIYVIRQGEQGIVFRFGRLFRLNVGAGLHFHIPSPVEKVERIPVDLVQRVEMGFRTVGRAAGSARAYQWESRHQTGAYEKRLDESLTFTGDENIIDVNTVVQYRVKDAMKYILNIEDPALVVASYSQASMRRVVSITGIDQLLTTDRIRIERLVAERLQALLDGSNSGIEVIDVKLQDVHPPVLAWASATFMISGVMPATLMSIWSEVIPASVPATLKSMSPRWSSSPRISVSTAYWPSS